MDKTLVSNNMTSNAVPLISILNASVMRDDSLALDHFNLEIAQGESIAVLGPNGSGKSTLLKLINRELYPLVKPETKVEILGQEHFDLNHYRKYIGWVSQDLQSSYQNDVLGLEVVLSGFFGSVNIWAHHQVTDNQITLAIELMKTLSIYDLRDRAFAQLSTGQKRRLLLARALVHKPDTLILDEPTNGLDLQACFAYLKIVNQLLRNATDTIDIETSKLKKTAIILVTHHLHEIPKGIQRVILIKEGKNQFDGDKKEALTDQRLSELFDTNLRVIEQNGIYQAYPYEPNYMKSIKSRTR